MKSAFFTWAYREHLISRKLRENVRWPKVLKDIKDIFTREEALKLLKTSEEYPEGLAARNRALILFLLDTGVRAAECCGLTVEHLDESYHRAKITGKGMRDRFVPIQKETREALWKYIHFHRPVPKVRTDTQVFLSHYGTPSPSTVLHGSWATSAHAPGCPIVIRINSAIRRAPSFTRTRITTRSRLRGVRHRHPRSLRRLCAACHQC